MLPQAGRRGRDTRTAREDMQKWRLYLFAASRTAFAKNQARWSLDGQTIDYIGTKLHMEQVSQLVVSEFRQAHSLLYNELLFDLDDYGGSWLTDERNAEILKGTQDALLRGLSLLTLIYIPPAPPLRAPELLSVTYTNTVIVYVRDTTISSCLRRAYARAEATTSITKEKFSAKERANFDLEEIAAAKEVEDKAALADLAGISNHSYRT
ncbi:hypothetical protein B0J15DRAFT_506029, partial [Fusarium solani]